MLRQIESAVQKAIHPDVAVLAQEDSDQGLTCTPGERELLPQPVSTYASSAQVVPFPMVDPYRPITDTGAPVAGLNAFPRRGRYFNGAPVKVFNGRGSDPNDKLPEGHDSFGFLDPALTLPSGVALPPERSSGPGTLQTILGTVQATLPATIAALRASPQNIYPGASYNPYATQTGAYPGGTGADVGARTGAAVGGVGDAIGGIIRDHPYLVLGGGLALVLLFMQPPRRR